MKELDAAPQIFIPGPEKQQPDAHWPPEVRKANAHPRNRFGHFILVAQVGCGASGTVFLAWDTRWKQFAAVKILHKMSAADLERFAIEAPHAAALRHPAIASMYEAGEHDGQWYVAMAYVEGRPIDAQPRSIALNVELVRDACRAVDYAHGQGITHGDLRPSNILVDRHDRVFVTDFGFKGATVQDDVRDLGAVLYTVLAGHADVSPELADVLTRATAEEPADRYRTAGELADELDRLLIGRRHTGRYGLAGRLARKWLPIGLGGAGLALAFAWLAPLFLSAEAETKPDPYKSAALAVLRLEESDDRPPLDELMAQLPAVPHARVLKARAAYAAGDRETAKRELAGLAGNDYRISFLRVLMEFEEALAQPLPLPAPEAPGAEWEGSLPDWRRFHDALTEVARSRVDSDSPLYAEHRRDAEAALALAALAEGQWLAACEKLSALNQRLPVYVAARRAASYLARRFDQVLDEPGTQFALAMESSHSPIDDLKRLRPLFAGREATLVCWAARRCVAQGVDPSTVTADGLDAESRGILAVAQLKWRSLACRDAESEYASAQKLLENPETWMGRLASIEARLGLGRRLKFRGGDSSSSFEEALTRINALPREWSVSRLLRAEALLGLNRSAEAIAEAKRAQSNSVREHLISSAASLRLSFRDERCLEDAMAASDRAVARGRVNPEALALQASIAILAAQTRQECPISLSEAVEKLTAALDRAPDYVEARFHRASAHHLLSERAPEPQRREHKRAAIEDLDRVLEAVPELAAARALRGIVRGSVDDLRQALKSGCSEPDEVKKWIRAAEAASSRK